MQIYFDYQGDYRLALTFSDGVHTVVDLEPLLHGEVFAAVSLRH